MKTFVYANPATVEDACSLLSSKWGETEVLAGGTDLVTSLKQRIVNPDRVVSITAVKGLDSVALEGKTLKIGALANLADLAWDENVKENFPSLVTAVKEIGSPQIVNQGTVAGDLCQRPRCWYFRNGLGLLATQDGKSLVEAGDNRYHAVFGNDGAAKFVNPSSLAPALIALGASAKIQGPGGKTRTVALADFFKTPKSESEREYVLAPNEIVTEIDVPVNGAKNATYEIRQRRGLDWPMVAAAVAFNVNGGKASNAKIVLGHVAPVPWNSSAAAAALEGKTVDEATAKAAGEAAAKGATPLSQNGYKVHQIKVAVKRAVLAAIA